MRFVHLLLVTALLGACSARQKSGVATVNLSVPTVAEFDAASSAVLSSSEKVEALSAISSGDMVAANACFLIDVSASDIPPVLGGACDLPSGVFQGSIPPATSSSAATASQPNGLQMQIPFGEKRKFQVFAYFRHNSTETCPTGKSLADFDRSRLSLIGVADNISIQDDVVNVPISVSFPRQTVAAQFNLPASCRTSVVTGATGGRVAPGAAVGAKTALKYSVTSMVGRSNSKSVVTTAGGYIVYRKRGAVQ